LGYTNYGQCVKEWAQDKNRNDNGYGGNHDHEGRGIFARLLAIYERLVQAFLRWFN
jgi:hypothetical protein